MRFLVAVIAVVLGCAGCTRARDRAELETFRAFGPELRERYIPQDPTLTPEQKVRRLRLVDAWERRVEAFAGEEAAP